MLLQATIRGYDLLDKIGAGAESVIYRAREVDTNRIVAIKQLTVDTPENYKYLRHLRNEYQILKSLENGHAPEGIVHAYRLIKSGFLRKRKNYALVMQYVDGIDLRREHRYPLGQLVEMMRHVADALSLLHRRRLIHGDLKPENIIISPTGQPTLVDFGFSCPVGSKPGSIRGTRDYMAPEQVDMRELTEKTDIYNFGATMYFLFGGKHVPALIAQPGDGSLFISGRRLETPSLRTLNPGVPPGLDELVLRCVRRDVFERPSCIDEVREALREVGAKYFG